VNGNSKIRRIEHSHAHGGKGGMLKIVIKFAWGMMLACALLAVAGAQTQPESKPDGGDLVIENTPLPDTYPRAPYEFRFHATGGVPTLHWHQDNGTLPPGMTFDDTGLLRGAAQRVGDYRFTVSVSDSAKPPQAVQREFVIRVVEAMTLRWKSLAHVTGNRIDGTVQVSNTTPDDIDLTFDVKAVAENGRATEIGYQHFLLHRGTQAMEIPFGETLPHGAYQVYVLAVGEVASRKLIYKQELQSQSALQVVVGP
jgi:Putative Ig domain